MWPKQRKKVSTILRFESAKQKWWNKPLIIFKGRVLPAELAILSLELGPGESGAWMNSRGIVSGVVDLQSSSGISKSALSTKRASLPGFVSEMLFQIFETANLKRGCPDLVIWDEQARRVRFVEVKCPHWDKPTREQEMFFKAAGDAGIDSKIIEWEFATPHN